MLQIHFHKYKYGKELLVDCFRLSEIAGRTLSLKEMHATTFYEIFFFFEGAGSLFLEGSKQTFKGPTALMLPPLQPRQWDLKTVPDCMMVIFEGEFMEAFMKDHLFLNRLYFFGNVDSPVLLPFKKDTISKFTPLLHGIRDEIKNLASDSHHLLRAYLYQLLILLNRAYAGHYQLKGNLYKNTHMLRFRELLKQHIREQQTVQQYADLLSMNRNRLNQLCKETFGKDAHTIIRNELLKSCKNELLVSNKTIAEISHEHNFSAPSNFVRFFKSLTQLSPAAYRQEYAN
jgi:AraC-like DNA-binding protein